MTGMVKVKMASGELVQLVQHVYPLDILAKARQLQATLSFWLWLPIVLMLPCQDLESVLEDEEGS